MEKDRNYSLGAYARTAEGGVTVKGNSYRKLYRIDRFARRFYCKHARLGQLRMDKKAAKRKARRIYGVSEISAH